MIKKCKRVARLVPALYGVIRSKKGKNKACLRREIVTI